VTPSAQVQWCLPESYAWLEHRIVMAARLDDLLAQGEVVVCGRECWPMSCSSVIR
jgi:hypothetical protein